ncbi:MAG: hypothetical protein ACFFD2_00135 [Promethearchaeota archaeon]
MKIELSEILIEELMKLSKINEKKSLQKLIYEIIEDYLKKLL